MGHAVFGMLLASSQLIKLAPNHVAETALSDLEVFTVKAKYVFDNEEGFAIERGEYVVRLQSSGDAQFANWQNFIDVSTCS